MVWHNILIINRPIPEKTLISWRTPVTEAPCEAHDVHMVYIYVCDPLCEIQAKVLI